jgi:hypothetical protein
MPQSSHGTDLGGAYFLSLFGGFGMIGVRRTFAFFDYGLMADIHFSSSFDYFILFHGKRNRLLRMFLLACSIENNTAVWHQVLCQNTFTYFSTDLAFSHKRTDSELWYWFVTSIQPSCHRTRMGRPLQASQQHVSPVM